MPIRINSTVQTGPNNQLGGLIGGLFIVAHQVETDCLVASEPINPAPSVKISEAMNLSIFKFWTEILTPLSLNN